MKQYTEPRKSQNTLRPGDDPLATVRLPQRSLVSQLLDNWTNTDNLTTTTERQNTYKMKKRSRDANTVHVLDVVRFGHRPPARCHKPTDRTDYNTLHRSWLARSVIKLTSCRRAAATICPSPGLQVVTRYMSYTYG